MPSQKENDICSVCGRTIINSAVSISDSDPRVSLKNGEILCMPCAGKIRVMFPVSYKVQVKGREPVPIDPMTEISAAAFDKLVEKAREYRESIRERFNWYDAIFQVEHAVIGKGGLLLSPIANAYGRVLCGSFWFADQVRIIRGSDSWEGEIGYVQRNIQEGYPDWLARPAKYVKEEIKKCKAHLQNAGEGYPYVLMIKTKNADLKTGDLIVKGGKPTV